MARITDCYPETNQDADINVDYDTYFAVGQIFHNSRKTVIDTVDLYLMKVGLPLGNITCNIYPVTGTRGTDAVPSGVAIASSDNFDVSTLSAVAYGLETFTFSGANRIFLEANTDYCVGFEALNTWTAIKCVQVGADSSAPTHSGNVALATSAGGALAADATQDLCFYVNVEDYEPPRAIQYGAQAPALPKKKYAVSSWIRNQNKWNVPEQEVVRKRIRKVSFGKVGNSKIIQPKSKFKI